MRPIRTRLTNHTYHGPTLDISDLPCRRFQPGHIGAWWTFTDEERAAIASGADLLVQIYNEPIPPVSLDVVPGEDEITAPFRHEPGVCKLCDQARVGG